MFLFPLYRCVWKTFTNRSKQNKLEFELRMQQYIEMLRAGERTEARQHAKKYLTPHSETYKSDILRAAGLMVFPPNTDAEPYKV